MFGLLYQECLQTGPLVFIWIFHFILPRVIRLFRVYPEWWIISFTPLHSLKNLLVGACLSQRWRICACVSVARDNGTQRAWQMSYFITQRTTAKTITAMSDPERKLELAAPPPTFSSECIALHWPFKVFNFFGPFTHSGWLLWSIEKQYLIYNG